MRNPSPLSIVSYLVFSVVLLGYGGSAIGQSSLPSAQEPTQESVNPSDFVPLPEEQSQFSSLTITPSPIVSTCPFPAITVSSQGQQAMDMGLTSTPSVYASESYTPGDGSDLDLDSRSSMLLSEGNISEALSLSQRIRDPQLQADSLLRIASSYVEAG